MNIRVTTEKRRFDITNLSESEGLVLRTLLNTSDEGLKLKLRADDLYWDSEITFEEAWKIAIEIRDSIFKAVDGED